MVAAAAHDRSRLARARCRARTRTVDRGRDPGPESETQYSDQLLTNVPAEFRRYARSGGVLFQTAPYVRPQYSLLPVRVPVPE